MLGCADISAHWFGAYSLIRCLSLENCADLAAHTCWRSSRIAYKAMYACVFLFFLFFFRWCILQFTHVYTNWHIQTFQNLQICSLFTMLLTWFHSLTNRVSFSISLHLLLLKATAGVGELSALWDILSWFHFKEQQRQKCQNTWNANQSLKILLESKSSKRKTQVQFD